MTLRLLLIFAIFIQLSPLTAQNSEVVAGRVILVVGEAEAVSRSGQRRSLQRRSEVYVGDTLVTATDARMQLRLVDDAILALSCNSSLTITNYQYENRNDDRVLLHLHNGGVRSITGTIQRVNYRFVTDAAEVTIEGTDFAVEADSATSFLFGVFDGSIRVQNSEGSMRIGSGSAYDFARAETGTAPLGIFFSPFSSNLSILGDIDCA